MAKLEAKVEWPLFFWTWCRLLKQKDVIMTVENLLLRTELCIYGTVYLVDEFKSSSRLDTFWMYQDIKCDFTAELTGTGDRSEYHIESY